MKLISLKSVSLEYVYLCFTMPDFTLNAELAQ